MAELKDSPAQDQDTVQEYVQESVQELAHDHSREPVQEHAPDTAAASQVSGGHNSLSAQASERTTLSDTAAEASSRSRSQEWKACQSGHSLNANLGAKLESGRRHHRTRASHSHQHLSDELDEGEGEDRSKCEHGDIDQHQRESKGKGPGKVAIERIQPIERIPPIETFVAPTPAPRSKKKSHGHSRSNSGQAWSGGSMGRGMNANMGAGIGPTPIQPHRPMSYSDGYASQYYRAAHRYAYGYSEGMQPIWYDQSAMAAIQPVYGPRGTPQPQPLPEGGYIPHSPLPPQPSYGWTMWMQPQYSCPTSPAYPTLPPPPPPPVFNPAYPMPIPYQQTPQPLPPRADLVDMDAVPNYTGSSQNDEDKEKRKRQLRDAIIKIEHGEKLAKEKAEAKEKRAQEKAKEKVKSESEEGRLDKGQQPDRREEYKAFFNNVLEKSLMSDRRFVTYNSPKTTKPTPVRELRYEDISKARPQEPTKSSIQKAYEEKLASQIRKIVESVDINQGTSGKATILQEESQPENETMQSPSHTRHVSTSSEKILRLPPGLPRPAANAMLPEPTPSEKRLENANTWFHTDNREERYFRRTVTALANRHASRGDRSSELGGKDTEKQIILLVGNAIASLGAYLSERDREHPVYFSAFRDVDARYCSGGDGSPARRTYFENDPLNNSSNIIGTSPGSHSCRAPSRASGDKPEKKLVLFRPRRPEL